MNQSFKKSFRIVIVLFFLWGFITVLNDVLIAYFKERYTLSDFESMFVQLFFFGAYGIGALSYYLFSHFKYDPINKLGYQNGMFYGALISGIGCSLFYPFMFFENYYINIIPLIVLGLGLTLLQIACNPYVILLGDEKLADSRLNLAQGLNSLGTALSPVIGGFFVFVYFEGVSAIQIPFFVSGLLFIGAAFIIRSSSLPAFNSFEIQTNKTLKDFPQLRWGMLAVFLYVGAEVAIGSKLIDFGQTDHAGNLSKFEASQILGFYWGGAMIGRLLIPILKSNNTLVLKIFYTLLLGIGSYFLLTFSISLSTYFNVNDSLPFTTIFKANISQAINFIYATLLLFAVAAMAHNKTSQSLVVFSLINILLLLGAFVLSGESVIWLVVAIGLFNSIMWSNIFVLATQGLGDYKSKGSALLIIMITGGAIFPMIMGLVADNFDLRIAYLLPIISYLYIIIYSRISFIQE